MSEITNGAHAAAITATSAPAATGPSFRAVPLTSHTHPAPASTQTKAAGSAM